MATQLERDNAYRKRQHDMGFAKMAFMFPIKYRHDLVTYIARKKKQWEKERNAL